MRLKERRRYLEYAAANAYPHGKCGNNAYWKIKDGILHITGTGGTYEYASYAKGPWNEYLALIDNIVIDEGITALGKNIFGGASVHEMHLPSTLTNFGYYNNVQAEAIYSPSLDQWLNMWVHAGVSYAPRLKTNGKLYINGEIITSVTIDRASLRALAFYSCSQITNVTLTETVTTISEYAFYGCSGITNLEIPPSVTTLKRNALDNMQGLTTLTLNDGLKTIDIYAIQNTAVQRLVIPESVETIASYAFQSNQSLLEARFLGTPVSLSGYGRQFTNCNSLTDIYVPWAQGTAHTDWIPSAAHAVIHYGS